MQWVNFTLCTQKDNNTCKSAKNFNAIDQWLGGVAAIIAQMPTVSLAQKRLVNTVNNIMHILHCVDYTKIA